MKMHRMCQVHWRRGGSVRRIDLQENVDVGIPAVVAQRYIRKDPANLPRGAGHLENVEVDAAVERGWDPVGVPAGGQQSALKLKCRDERYVERAALVAAVIDDTGDL